MTITIESSQGILSHLSTLKEWVNGYVFYGAHHESLTHSTKMIIEGYFQQEQPSFKWDETTLNTCPDILFLSEEKSIKVEHIRTLQERVKYGPSVMSRLFVIIEKADLLTTQASNAFLKSLEEPLDGVTFILLTHRVKSLLPTILSRCQTYYLPSTQSTIPESLIAITEFKTLSFNDRMQYLATLSQDKHQSIMQIDIWIKDIFNQDYSNLTIIKQLLDISSRLQFNVNCRLQLEQIALII